METYDLQLYFEEEGLATVKIPVGYVPVMSGKVLPGDMSMVSFSYFTELFDRGFKNVSSYNLIIRKVEE